VGVLPVVVIVRVEVKVTSTGLGLKEADAPVGSPEMTLRVTGSSPLPLRANEIGYVVELSGEIGPGDCAPTTTLRIWFESVNVVCAWETEPTAVRLNLTSRSCVSVTNELSEIFPLA